MNRLVFLFLIATLSLFASENNCPFCNPDIISKQQVYESPFWRVLIDFQPTLPGHLLIIPIAHRSNLYELSREEFADLYDVEQKVHRALVNRYGRVIEDLQYEKNGPTLQSVPHFHIHVLPVTKDLQSMWQKLLLGAKLFLFPSGKLSQNELEQEKKEYVKAFES